MECIKLEVKDVIHFSKHFYNAQELLNAVYLKLALFSTTVLHVQSSYAYVYVHKYTNFISWISIQVHVFTLAGDVKENK